MAGTLDDSNPGARNRIDSPNMDVHDILHQAVSKCFASPPTLSISNLLLTLLTEGGDERLRVDPKTGLTKYNSQPLPCEGVHRSSSTSNVPTKEAFMRGMDVVRRLVLEARQAMQKRGPAEFKSVRDVYSWFLGDIRERLRTVLRLTLDDCINIFPSGTDAEFLPTLLALARCAVRKNGRSWNVLSVVTAGGEVGSGTAQASGAKTFAKQLPDGSVSVPGNDVLNTESSVQVAEVKIRGESGALRSVEDTDAEVVKIVSDALGSKETGVGVVILHQVIGSKTGHSVPTTAAVDQLRAAYGKDRVIVVVDACQGRMDPNLVRRHLDREDLVLFTGSKFFGGPAFSGSCITPIAVAEEIEGYVEKGAIHAAFLGHLSDYATASLLSNNFPKLKDLLPDRALNYGCLVRWSLALHEMECYSLLADRTKLIQAWNEMVRDIARNASASFITLLEDEIDENIQISSSVSSGVSVDGNLDKDELSAALSTIVPFLCKCRDDPRGKPRAMTMAELRRVQQVMATDLTTWEHLELPAAVAVMARSNGLLSIRCFMGQPVQLGSSDTAGVNVLRVSASAPLIARMAMEGPDVVTEEDHKLFMKLAMVLQNWGHFAKDPAPSSDVKVVSSNAVVGAVNPPAAVAA